MNQPKKLTPAQEKIVSENNLNPNDYYLLEETESYYIVVKIDSRQKKWIYKSGKEKNNENTNYTD